jgi:hypothetical protein
VNEFTDRPRPLVLTERAQMEAAMNPKTMLDLSSLSLRTIGLFCAVGLIVSYILIFGMNAREIAEFNDAGSAVTASTTPPVESHAPVAFTAR